MTVKSKPIYDTGAFFSRLLVVGQQRSIDVFDHELSSVPPSLIDEFCFLRKGYKSVLIKKLEVTDENTYFFYRSSAVNTWLQWNLATVC